MLTLEWESEGLQTVGIVVIICASLKLLHLLGLIDFSEGKRGRPQGEGGVGALGQVWLRSGHRPCGKLRLNSQGESFRMCMLAFLEPFLAVHPAILHPEGRGLRPTIFLCNLFACRVRLWVREINHRGEGSIWG